LVEGGDPGFFRKLFPMSARRPRDRFVGTYRSANAALADA
jgi:hypothetical protein